MRLAPLALGSLLCGASFGCSETPTPTTPVAPPEPAAVVAPPVDLSPVAEPADLLAVARWKSPTATLQGVSGCAGLPGDGALAEARVLVDQALASMFRGGFDARPIAELVALDASVDLVAALDSAGSLPQARVAFGVGLRSLDRAREALLAHGDLVELAPGMWRVGSKGGSDLTCAVGAAAGAAPARLVCGPREKDVTALGPYVARSLPAMEPPRGDLSAELRFAPMEARYGALIRRGLGYLPTYLRNRTDDQPRFAAAVEQAALALADEGGALAADLDRLRLDVAVDPKACLQATAALELRGRTSWVAGALVAGAAEAAPPPAIFWRAPVDSDAASYGLAADAARYQGMLRALRDILTAKLEEEQIGTEADRAALGGLVALPFKRDTHVVVASGRGAGGPAHAPAPGDKDGEQAALDEMVRGYVGWTLIGFDEGPDAAAKLLKDVAAALGRKALTDGLGRALHLRGAMPTAKLVKAPRELGAGALDLEIRIEADAKPKATAAKAPAGKAPAGKAAKAGKPLGLSVHLLLMPDGKQGWMAIGVDREQLVKHLLAAKSGAPEAGTLAARPGLEPLRSGKALGSGFFTLSAFTGGLRSALGNPTLTRLLPHQARGPAEEVGRTLGALPNKGETPMFWATATQDGPGPRGELRLEVQRGSFEDLGVLVTTGLRLANRSRAAQQP